MVEPKKGVTFTHKTFLAMHNSPRGQKARMRVTSVRKGNVYYTYDTELEDKGAFYLPTDVWMERYGS